MKQLVKAAALIFIVIATVQTTYAMPHDVTPGTANTQAISGKVLETINFDDYTYVYVENKKDRKKVWVVVPAMELKEGRVVTFMDGVVAEKYKSKRLNRTFDRIIFSEGVKKR